MSINRRLLAVPVVAGLLALAAVLLLQQSGAQGKAHFNYSKLNRIQRRLISGTLESALLPHTVKKSGGAHIAAGVPGRDDGTGADGFGTGAPAGYGASTATTSAGALNYNPSPSGKCDTPLGGNVKVNVNCLNIADPALQGRSQANNETFIAQDALHPQNIVASDNNYIRGDGTCGAHFSTDGGNSWSDSTIPNGFTYGLNGDFAREYWQAGGDTSVAWDTHGNAYESCQVFNRGVPTSPNTDQSSGFLVFRSTGNKGASWNFPGRFVTSFFDPTGTSGVLEDKQLMTIDDNLRSPYRDRIYVTWTEFAANGTAYIYESHSSDYGETFSPKVLVSGSSARCANTFGVATPNGPCNENQFSDPFVGSDGNLYVVWANFNNAVSGNDNRNQMLLAKSTDGGQTFSEPVKVSDYYDLPDCDTYQGAGSDSFRACVPEKAPTSKSVFRATNYPTGVVDPTNPSRVVVVFGSYINRDSNESNGCAPDGFASDGINMYTGVKTPGACNNKILISTSTNGGQSFSDTHTDPRRSAMVTTAPGQKGTDQWFQWAAFTRTGTLAVDYYDRQYGSDETTGDSDFSLSGSSDLASFGQSRVTSSSMPPPTEFPNHTGAGQFYGDYIGLAAVEKAHPIWSDTRSSDRFLCPGSSPPALCEGIEPNGEEANDEETYSATMSVPTG